MDQPLPSRHQEPIRLVLPGGGTLQGHLAAADRPGDLAVLYVHGFGSVRSGEKALALEQACMRHGLTFAAFDFRGHGESSGTLLDLRGSTLQEDLDAIHAHLAERGIRRLCLAGSSMGGWASAWFACRHPTTVIPACVLMAPALDFIRHRWASLTDAERRAWQQTGRLRVHNEWLDAEIAYPLVEEADRYPLTGLMSAWHTPLLIFHGMKDETIPYKHSLHFVEGTGFGGIELRLFGGGDHRLSAWKDEIAEATCDFFRRRLG